MELKNLGANVLSRLFGRSESPLVAQLFTHAIGKPLLVHPQMGQQLIGAYLHGAVEARPSTVSYEEIEPGQTTPEGVVLTPARNIGVLNISGALVNRYQPGMCDPGPLSYEALRAAFDQLLADPTVEAIVMRIESLGGMASGLFDLADHIFESRGKKPIVAMIDDYAYSAAYGLAAAADEIWITRTGGAGSVGVRAFHVDQSAWNEKQGLKVTEIIAGARKADLSPHAPLSEEALERLQFEVNGLRQMFAASVAKYRGMTVEDVLATEALTYMGEDAIKIGFADRLGTYIDLMAELVTDPETPDDTKDESTKESGAAEQKPIETSAAAAVATEPAKADPAMAANAALGLVMAAVTAAQLNPAVTMALMKRAGAEAGARVTPDNVEAAISDARAIDDACAAANLREAAADYVARGVSLTKVREDLVAAVADTGPEIVTAHPVLQPGAVRGATTKSQEIYSRRAAAAGSSRN